jgi:hypothetical protein
MKPKSKAGLQLKDAARFKKKYVNRFSTAALFLFHLNFVSSIIENKEVGETSHTLERWAKCRSHIKCSLSTLIGDNTNLTSN